MYLACIIFVALSTLINASTGTAPTTTESIQKQAECMACDDVFELLNYWLTSPLTQGGVQIAMNDICITLGQSTQEYKYCLETVNGTFFKIIDMVEVYTDEACIITLDCPPSDRRVGLSPELSATNMCTMLSSLAEKMPIIAPNFINLCAELDDVEAQSTCLKTINDNPLSVINMGIKFAHVIFNKVPGVNCPMPPLLADDVLERKLHTEVAAISKNDLQCQACWGAIEILNYLIGSPLVEGSVIGVLAKTCDKLGALAPACVQSLNGTIVHLVQDIQGFVNLTCPSSALHCDQAASYTSSKATIQNAGFNGLCDLMKPVYDNIPNTFMYWQIVCTQMTPPESSSDCHKFFQTNPVTVIELVKFFLPTLIESVTGQNCA